MPERLTYTCSICGRTWRRYPAPSQHPECQKAIQIRDRSPITRTTENG